MTYYNTFRLNLSRELNGWYLFCASGNQNLNPVSSNKILLNVTYPPDGSPIIAGMSNGSEVNVFQNDNVRLECSVTGGNPLPRLEWNNNNESPAYVNGNTLIKSTSLQATGRDPLELICQSFHIHKNGAVYVNVNILNPPETPTIKIKTSSMAYLQVYKTLHVIEGLPFTLNCSADSNPPLSLFKWNNMMPTDSSIFYVANADRRNAENIACKVSNTMQTRDSSTPRTGSNIIYLEVNVLYPPTMNIAREEHIIEGNNLDNLCNFTPGNPPDTNITWSWKDLTWNVNPHQPYIVSRNQSGVYRCSVRNVMVSSDGTRVFGNASGEFNLSVQYLSKVLKFVYVWTRKVETSDTWFNLTSSGNKSQISTRGLQSNLTIKDVSQFDYGLYRLFINNDVGHFSHTLNLSLPVYINEDTTTSSNAVEVASGTVGGVVVLVVVTITAIVYKRRKGLSKTNDDTSSQYYNLDATKAGDDNNPVDGGSSNFYEGLHKRGLDQQYESLSTPACKMEKADGCSSNFYEGLQNKGLDQQYDTISSNASKIESGNHKAYENLQLTRTTDRHPVGESSEAVKSISKKEHAQTIV